jgi:hypothetical protein
VIDAICFRASELVGDGKMMVSMEEYVPSIVITSNDTVVGKIDYVISLEKGDADRIAARTCNIKIPYRVFLTLFLCTEQRIRTVGVDGHSALMFVVEAKRPSTLHNHIAQAVAETFAIGARHG